MSREERYPNFPKPQIASLPIFCWLESKSHGYWGVLGGPLGMYRVVGIHMAQGLELRVLGFWGLRHPDSFDKRNLRIQQQMSYSLRY